MSRRPSDYTFGPAFDREKDGIRIDTQRETIRCHMLARDAWHTLAEIEEALDYPQSSISAQLRHLKKPQFGGHILQKRRRNGQGTWEYRLLPPPPATPARYEQTSLLPRAVRI